MGKISDKKLHKLCIHGVTSTTDYWRLKKLNKRENWRPEYKRETFKFSKYSASETLLWFRFTPREIIELIKGLKIPKTCKLSNKISFSGLEGLCIVLRRLCYPNRLVDLVPMFKRDPGSISRIFNFMIDFLYRNHVPVLTTLKQPYIANAELRKFAEASSLAGCPYPNIVGYIDGTARNVCRPTYQQKDLYSGYKKHHTLKYQSIVWPNGLIGRLDGPFIGRRHDSAILHLSGVLSEMRTVFNNDDGTWYATYGDPGYSNQKYIKVGYKNHSRLNEKQKEFNAVMSSVRVSVEYGFGRVIQQFAFLDYHKNQKCYLQPLKKMYYVAAILTNCQTCLRGGNQISDMFSCAPPSLQEYLQ